MASPITPSTGRALSLTPGARVLQSHLSDDTIWKRLKEAGFDEDSIKRRDKAALIAYIAKLETEIFDLQHHMGLLILERKDLASKNEQIKASAEAAELSRKRHQAAHLSALAEARKREESLKKALGVEKECIASMEKALHEMRAESAENKVAAECQLAEAQNMVEDSQQKFIDAASKLHAAEALQAEASRYHRAAERKLQEVEAREDDLSRRISTFKTDCDAKETEMSLERQSLSERRKVLQQEHERLLDGKALLNQREDYVASKLQELNQLAKTLEASKENIEEERKALNDEKSNLQLTVASLAQREEAIIEREALLNKREQDLLVLQEKLASKESIEIQKVVANHETVLKTRKSEFDTELEMKRKLVEDEIEAKRRAWELREVDLSQWEDVLHEREHDLEIQSRALVDKEKDFKERINILDDKERNLSAAEKDVELRSALVQKEKEEIKKMKLEFQKSLDSLEDKKKKVNCAMEKLETMKSETTALAVLEMKLKEEVDIVRAQKLELMVEEDRLKIEKAKFEAEWELIDEKREELRKDAECIAEERKAVSRLLKDERDSLRQEKEAMRDQHKHDVESLNREREEFMNKMMQERSGWFSRIQQEQSDFLFGIEMQKRELESSIEKRREEVESYLKDKEKGFELEKKNELQHISSLREKAAKELEQVALEMKKLDIERMEINVNREQRDREWAVLNESIEELKAQTHKLEKQRELLHAEREAICAQIETLKKLEDMKLALDDKEVAEMQLSYMESSWRKISSIRSLKQQTTIQDSDLVSHKRVNITNNGDQFNSPMQKPDVASPPNSARLSWLKRCTELIFKNSPERPLITSGEKSLIPDHEDASFMSAGKLGSSNGYLEHQFKLMEIFGKRQPMRDASGEPKLLLEVPHGGEIAKGTHVESEIKEDANERNTHSTSENALQARKKRRARNLPLDDSVDPLPVQTRNSKKRRQQENAALNLSKVAANHSVTSTEASLPEDQHATEGGAEGADVLIIEKIIKISEVTCEIADVDNSANQEKLVCVQNSETSGHNVVQDAGTNGHSISRDAEDSKLPSGLEASETLKEGHVGNIGHGVEQIQSQGDTSEQGDLWVEDYTSQQGGLRVEDSGVAKSESSEKLIEDNGKRRSKQTL